MFRSIHRGTGETGDEADDVENDADADADEGADPGGFGRLGLVAFPYEEEDEADDGDAAAEKTPAEAALIVDVVLSGLLIGGLLLELRLLGLLRLSLLLGLRLGFGGFLNRFLRALRGAAVGAERRVVSDFLAA
jgi:hypothetical protein